MNQQSIIRAMSPNGAPITLTKNMLLQMRKMVREGYWGKIAVLRKKRLRAS